MNIYKTMYRPHKPTGIDGRKAYIVGGGIAGLATAVFLIDDAKMPGQNITIYEKKQVFHTVIIRQNDVQIRIK